MKRDYETAGLDLGTPIRDRPHDSYLGWNVNNYYLWVSLVYQKRRRVWLRPSPAVPQIAGLQVLARENQQEQHRAP